MLSESKPVLSEKKLFENKIEEVENEISGLKNQEEENTMAILMQQQLEIRVQLKNKKAVLEYLKEEKNKAEESEGIGKND